MSKASQAWLEAAQMMLAFGTEASELSVEAIKAMDPDEARRTLLAAAQIGGTLVRREVERQSVADYPIVDYLVAVTQNVGSLS